MTSIVHVILSRVCWTYPRTILLPLSNIVCLPASLISQVVDDSVKEAYSTLQFHPDGLILGTGMCAVCVLSS
jgi:hypothetical protein